MTTYSTGNPVGSPDPRDLYDNAENLDNAANSDNATWTDRLGQSRRTMAGIEHDAVTAVQNAGYVGTGTDNAVEDYAAGIEITQYNQIVRDPSTGEFWRVSGSETLPYTLTGTGVPEGGALVSVGDAALRQDLVQPVATFNNVADMKAATGLGVGRKVRTLGYYAPGDGGGCDYEIVAAGAGSNYGFLFEQLTASGLEAKLLGGGVMEDKTAYIPSDYATLQDALARLISISRRDAVVNVVIETGHEITDGVIFYEKDFSGVMISSEDPVVTLAQVFNFVTAGESVFYFSDCKAPTLNCLIDLEGRGGRAFVLTDLSSGVVLSDCGMINAGTDNLYMNGVSSLLANNSIWTGAGRHGCWVTRCSSFSAENSNFSNAGQVGINIRRASYANVQGSKANNCGNAGVVAARAYVNFQGRPDDGFFAEATGNAVGITAERGATITANRLDISGNIGDNVVCISGSNIEVSDANIDSAGRHGISCQGGSVFCINSSINNSFENGINAGEGGLVSAKDAQVNDSGGRGVYARGGSAVSVEGASILRSSGTGIDCQSAKVTAEGATIDDSGSFGIFCNNGTVSIKNGNVRRAANNGVRADSGTIFAQGCDARKVDGSDEVLDFNVTSGGIIHASSSTGGFAVDTNTISDRGIIFN